MTARWLVIYTMPRHEKSVARHLEQRRITNFLPICRSNRTWKDGSRGEVELPLFPGYVFVKIASQELGRLLEVPGVLTLVSGTGGEPAAFPDTLIQALRQELSRRPVEPHPLLTVGERARIRSGAFAGMEGIVARTKKGVRVILTVEYILRSIAVEVDSKDLEPLAD